MVGHEAAATALRASWRGYRQRLREGEASAWIASFEYEPDARAGRGRARRPRGHPTATPRRPRRPSCLAARGRALRGRGVRGACGGRPAHRGARAHRADEVRPDAGRARRRARVARGIPAPRPRASGSGPSPSSGCPLSSSTRSEVLSAKARASGRRSSPGTGTATATTCPRMRSAPRGGYEIDISPFRPGADALVTAAAGRVLAALQ